MLLLHEVLEQEVTDHLEGGQTIYGCAVTYERRDGDTLTRKVELI